MGGGVEKSCSHGKGVGVYHNNLLGSFYALA